MRKMNVAAKIRHSACWLKNNEKKNDFQHYFVVKVVCVLCKCCIAVFRDMFINRLVSSTFTQEQKSNLKFERNNELTFIVIIIDID